jgi:hypothetical protein
MGLVQVFEDGQGLVQALLAIDQQRHQPGGGHRGVGLAVLLPLARWTG